MSGSYASPLGIIFSSHLRVVNKDEDKLGHEQVEDTT